MNCWRELFDYCTGLNGQPRVLVVDDEPINREIVFEFLDGTGLVVDLAGNGVEAVELARHMTYEIILMDMQMPYMDGLEATRRIRRIPGRTHVPILAISANVAEDARERCLAAGMNDYLAKPITPDGFCAALLRLLKT